MIGKKMADALNGQVNAELYSAYLYLSMEAYLESAKLSGFARWMRAQTQEEVRHAMKIYDFVNEQGGRVILTAIAQPASEWESPLAVSEAVCKHEAKVTGLINDLVELAVAEKDEATNNFLQWFVKEQVEEEESAGELFDKVRSAGDSAEALSKVDNELGKREIK